MSVYPKVEVPKYIRYVLNSIDSVSKLNETNLSIGYKWGDSDILVVNMRDYTWDTTNTFQWLYRDKPELTHIDDVISEIIDSKIEKLTQ